MLKISEIESKTKGRGEISSLRHGVWVYVVGACVFICGDVPTIYNKVCSQSRSLSFYTAL